MKCPDCPHEEHEFSSCFQWPDCDCNQRKPSFCDNSLIDVLRPKKEKFVVANRTARRKKKKK